ncbi:hypothetical protein HMPREF0868_0002 [Mageeibacillus indolicus UPII9-5]|uniref:Uncharacterized protein n=1 Tax=Mageeibacillus indolicus (strain UPII9-5) TaxID=699246 RepID=D3QZK2_MAGIU|nr:hypothetical protein [Mageeibacillus indolicus]ADC91629.1 hypothetical protein HMPREF0868_0002 [Mageeibacillus indolicus UPII9-5]
MNKGFKVLSSVLAMSMVLASGVFALDWNKGELDILEHAGFKTLTGTKEVNENVLYMDLLEKGFKESLKKFDDALNAVVKDANIIAKLGNERCKAQFELDSANNQILATDKFIELAKGIETINVSYKRLSEVDNTVGDVSQGDRKVFAKDAKKLKELLELNKKYFDDLAEAKKSNTFNIDAYLAHKKSDTLLGAVFEGEKTNLQLFEGNDKEISDLLSYTAHKNYTEVVKRIEPYATREGADRAYSDLDLEAKKATTKINLINNLAKQYKVTLRACSLADYTAKASGKAAKAEDKNNAKKDDVPNTASYFPIYVPSCQVSAPAVKYYGAAQVYEKVLRRPLVCKKVETKTVKVPMFTFDEITAYDVACCCCK